MLVICINRAALGSHRLFLASVMRALGGVWVHALKSRPETKETVYNELRKSVGVLHTLRDANGKSTLRC